MAICAFSRNPSTALSYHEDLYLETIAKYKDYDSHLLFPKMLSCLVDEMTERIDSETGFDILGEFYENNLYKKGTSQYFTPWPICKFMAQITLEESMNNNKDEPLRILDPACGSGRMLMAASRIGGPSHMYFGIDIDHTCVKMAAINFFLGGMFKSEVVCGNALIPNDFKVSYRISSVPFGIFKIKEKEKSLLWLDIPHQTVPLFHSKVYHHSTANCTSVPR